MWGKYKHKVDELATEMNTHIYLFEELKITLNNQKDMANEFTAKTNQYAVSRRHRGAQDLYLKDKAKGP